MKKIIFFIATIATISFTSCNKDKETCKDCEILFVDYTICDNGDDTATITYSILGDETTSTIDLDGQSVEDIDCNSFGL